MPTVESYGQPKVNQAPLPGARLSGPADVAQTPDSLGAAKAEALAGLGATAAHAGLQTLDVVQQIQERERQKADQIAVLAADRQLADLQHNLVDGPNGALNVKGGPNDLMPLHDKTLSAYDDQASQIGSTLTNDTQRIAFARSRDSRRESIGNAIDAHTNRGIQEYDAGETKGYVDTAQSAALSAAANTTLPAAQRMQGVATELGRGEAAIRGYAQRNGTAPALADAQVVDFRSGVHLGVIDQMLATDQAKAAQIYFEETKDQIAGDKLADVEKALEEGTLRKQSQQQADAIVGAGGSLTEQRAKVRAIDDPKLRDAVSERVEHEAAVQEKIDRDTDEARLKSAYDIVDQSKSITGIPASTWTALPGASRASLREYATRLAKGEPIDTDIPTYYGLLQKASAEPEKFINDNLLNYRTRLGDPEFKQLAGLQVNLRNGQNEEAAKALDGYRTTATVIDDTLHQAGIDTSASKDNDDFARVAQFRRQVDDRIQSLQRLTGKKITTQDVQGVTDDLLKQVTTAPPAWWTLGFGSPTTKRKFELTVSDVPAADRAQIENALRAHKRPVTDDAVLGLYLAHQEGK